MVENFLKKEEELSHFRREDIKTMEKDVTVIRDKEARTEREKIIQLNRLQTKPRQGIKDIIAKPPEELPIEQSVEEESPKISKIKGSSKKILVRGFIILILIALTFSATKLPWNRIKEFFVKPVIVNEPPIEGPNEEEPEEIEEPTEFVAPASLITVQNTFISEVDNKDNAFEALTQALNQDVPQNSLNRIVLKYVPENRALNLDEIPLIPAFGTELLPAIYPKLGSDYTLALYPQNQGLRTVLISKVKDSQDLIILFKSWEEEIVQNAIVIDQKTVEPLVPYFRTSFYNNVGLRYLTLSKEDLGICYAYFDDYFVISSSLESFKKAIDVIGQNNINQ